MKHRAGDSGDFNVSIKRKRIRITILDASSVVRGNSSHAGKPKWRSA